MIELFSMDGITMRIKIKLNMNKGILLFIAIIVGVNSIYSQTNFYTGFEENIDKYYPQKSKEKAVYVMQLQLPQWTNGISGRALDLSENAVLRKPLVIDSLETPDYGMNDFSVQVWVKTIKGAVQGTPIIGNTKDEDPEGPGWKILTQENGAWGVWISDGKSEYRYLPTPGRQAINDGEWHQLAFSIDREKEEAWFFKDGKNVAIYNTPNLGSLNSNNRTVVGGTYEYWEYGSSGQWTAFNGYLDEVNVKSSYQNSTSIKEDFNRFKTLEEDDKLDSPLRTMVWNIWHGGRRYGKHVGVERVVQTIKQAQPDVVALIETYGSGEIIADALGYHFYLISSNLSIMSRFPINKTIKAFRPFNFGGAEINLGGGRRLTFLNTWLHYLPDYSKNVIEGAISAEDLINAEKETRQSEVESILKEIKPLHSKSGSNPVIMLGDFNSGSHLDWIESTKGIHNGYTIDWPVSLAMINAGFKDSFRELNINPLLDPGLTWTPRAATSSNEYGLRDRIDYIYYKGGLIPIESKVIDYHPLMFPSDHAAVITVFDVK
ncbi:endonuclease/exonuclease/phosphatase family protein [Maribacter sp. HTCC2170]|uniref:endonuclease/exonuclease/phosphatase family protein n=1 Tax=Maribacter sp. (strain HTCC2170 / KCCM 42371) TaxID=313603 RepID=UPI00006B494D|nr:endonuclease/exonuclease/phosphatase family protein [Maribacter sp. HTCC2170]EAR00979.1 putative exported phosphatase [Maribacter sp. HTCC2170]